MLTPQGIVDYIADLDAQSREKAERLIAFLEKNANTAIKNGISNGKFTPQGGELYFNISIMWNTEREKAIMEQCVIKYFANHHWDAIVYMPVCTNACTEIAFQADLKAKEKPNAKT